MADTNPFPRTVASITREGKGPQTHAYDDPDIGPIEFLLAVMRAQHLPMATRISAASALLPFTEPRPGPRPTNSVPRCTIVIGGIPPEALDRITADHSQNPLSANKGPSHNLSAQGSQNIEATPEPSYLPDYSIPQPLPSSKKSKPPSTNSVPILLIIRCPLRIYADAVIGYLALVL